jgi:hypothetical protein
MTDQMLLNPPSLNDTLESWSYKIFGKEKFGMVLNNLEEYSNSFSEKVAIIVKPLLERSGLPLGGLSFLFFMGNYGFTPFGIHKEAVGEEGILFHLGPGPKEFYTWDNSKYNAIEHNTEVFHNIDKMLPDAKRYNLEPGDAMFIPHQVYHIANSSDFSISFVMDYINPPTDFFENQLLKTAGEEDLLNNNTFQKPVNFKAPFSKLYTFLNQKSFQHKLETAFQRKVLCLKSNVGILHKSNSVNGVGFSNGDFSISSRVIFPLFIEELTNDKTIIYARGHRITKKYHPRLSQLIRELNEGSSLKIECLKKILLPIWDLIEILSIVQDLIRVDAIIIEN